MLLTTMYYALLVSSVHISNVNDLEELQVLKIMFVGWFGGIFFVTSSSLNEMY